MSATASPIDDRSKDAPMTRLSVRLLLPVAALLAASPAAAQAIGPDCAPLVGTWLTLKSDDPTADPGEVGRSLVSLTNDGIAFMVDSAQGGGDAFQPFSQAAGGWTCDGIEGNAITFRAAMIDFTFPTEAMPDQQVVRVDIDGALDRSSGAVSGETTVTFFPVGADPFDADAATEDTGYDFTARKVTPDE